MTERGVGLSRLFLTSALIASLSAGLLCGVACGHDLSGKSFRIRAAAFAPIGRIYSLGEISINGRVVSGNNPIWSGDLLQAHVGSTAQVVIDSVGSVALGQATEARLAVRLTSLDDATKNFVLIVSLISGAASVRLFEGASAYLEVNGSAFAARKGSSFRTQIRDGRAEIDAISGALDIEPGMPVQPYFVDMYRYDVAKKRPPMKLGENPQAHRVKPNSKNSLAAQSTTTRSGAQPKKGTVDLGVEVGLVRHLVGYTLQQTSQRIIGAPGRTLKFEIDKPVGTLVTASGISGQSVTAVTDAQGFAQVTFEAGPQEGSTKFTVEDVSPPNPEETRDNWYGTIIVKKGFWQQWRNTVIVGAIAAAVGTVIIKGRSKPLRQEPPPQIP
jgi:hypothetical protein